MRRACAAKTGPVNPMQTTIHITPDQFTTQETPLVQQGQLCASLFRYPSGVCGLRLRNALGDLMLLPYQGQQIWDASMRGRRLTMKSMFDAPIATRDFLSSYGGFLLHCGATGMGVPGKDDKHPLHGELHSAPYQGASVLLGADERGAYIGLTGSYRHTQAFACNYVATPLVKLYADSSVFCVEMTIHNQKASAMPLMFLEHINFLPVDGARLAQTVICDPQNMRVRENPGASVDGAPGHDALVRLLLREPQHHLVFKPGQAYDPEVVLYLRYLADASGWARTLQIHPDGSSDLVRHRPQQLSHGVRWLCRTPDQDAFGVEPCTAEVDGFSAERAKGHVLTLAAGAVFRSALELGVLDPGQTRHEESLIRQTLLARQ